LITVAQKIRPITTQRSLPTAVFVATADSDDTEEDAGSGVIA
jgi:hypothetical protein